MGHLACFLLPAVPVLQVPSSAYRAPAGQRRLALTYYQVSEHRTTMCVFQAAGGVTFRHIERNPAPVDHQDKRHVESGSDATDMSRLPHCFGRVVVTP